MQDPYLCVILYHTILHHTTLCLTTLSYKDTCVYVIFWAPSVGSRASGASLALAAWRAQAPSCRPELGGGGIPGGAMYIHIHVCACMYVCMYVCMHICKHMYVYIYIHSTYTHMHIYIYIHLCSRCCQLCNLYYALHMYIICTYYAYIPIHFLVVYMYISLSLYVDTHVSYLHVYRYVDVMHTVCKDASELILTAVWGVLAP